MKKIINKKYFYTFLLICIFLILLDKTPAQNLKGQVKGQLNKENITPIQSAKIRWLGGSGGTLSNQNGEFEIRIPPTTLKFEVSALGFKTDTIKIEPKQFTIEVILKPDLKLEEVIVTSELPSKIINKANVISSELITQKGLRKAACCNLSESFETNASVDVNYTDAITGAKKIMLLGLSGEYSQILTEKVQNYNGLITSYGLGYVPGTWINSIQISKGSSSVTTGYQSMVGQINVEYKKPEDLEQPLLNIYANSIGRYELNYDFSNKISEEIFVGNFIHLSTLQNNIDGNNDGFLDFNKGYQFNYLNKWKIQKNDYEMQIGAKIIFDEKNGGQFEEQKNQKLFEIFNNTKRVELWSKTGIFLSEKNNSSIGIINFISHHNQNVILGNRNWNAEQNTFNLNVLYDTDLVNENQKITSGFSFLYDNFIEDFSSLNQIDTIMKRTELVPGVFMEYTNKLIENLVIIGGIRNDFHNLYGNLLTPRLHFNYKFNEETYLKGSIGKGFRVPNVIADNLGMIANNRIISFEKNIKIEESINYGLNFLTEFEIFNKEININIDFFRTEFNNKLIVDMDAGTNLIKFYNLIGKAYSNSMQIELTFELFKRFNVNTAYRINDVRSTINGVLDLVPMVNRSKTFINLEYTTELNDWNFDYTLNINGGGRLPHTKSNPIEFQKPENYSSFVIMNAQVGYNIYDWGLDTYLGVENITNLIQSNPIIDPNNPFKSDGYFDAAIVYAPVYGRIIYFGLRYNL